jgi:hypothetical protein
LTIHQRPNALVCQDLGTYQDLGSYLAGSLPAYSEPVQSFPSAPMPKTAWSAVWPMVQMVGAAFLGASIFVGFDLFWSPRSRIETAQNLGAVIASAQSWLPATARSKREVRQEVKEATPTPEPIAHAQAPAFPIPTVYGVYAVSNGQLVGLEPLPIRVPDQRVAISGTFAKPSSTKLPDGRIAFVVFRRDLVTNAPEKASVRIVARVVRALAFNSAGKPAVTNMDGLWAVRGNSYEFRVAPVNDNQEMIVIRPETADFSLPAGRYALMLKGQAYDFSVDGPITETAQCVERTEASNGTFYSECHKP